MRATSIANGESTSDGLGDTLGGGSSYDFHYDSGEGDCNGDGRDCGDGVGHGRADGNPYHANSNCRSGGGEGRGDADGIGDSVGNGSAYFGDISILEEIGVPREKHWMFKPLTQSSMLEAAAFAAADSTAEQDAIIGLLELRKSTG